MDLEHVLGRMEGEAENREDWSMEGEGTKIRGYSSGVNLAFLSLILDEAVEGADQVSGWRLDREWREGGGGCGSLGALPVPWIPKWLQSQVL